MTGSLLTSPEAPSASLRPYQVEAVDAVYRYLREHDDNPVVVLPTGSGKTHVLTRICRDAVSLWGGRVLILAHVKELLQQAVDKLTSVAPELMMQVGVYSAGLKSRDTEHPIIVAGIQSVYRKAKALGHFDIIVVDECHRIPPDGEGRYRTLLGELQQINPLARVIGLTATPFRMTTGSICRPDHFLNAVCYEAGVRELIAQGYLCPLISKAGRVKADTSALHVRAGEFVASETEALMDNDALVEAACREMVSYMHDRHSCLVFAAGVRHGEHIATQLKGLGQRVATVFGDTLSFERDKAIADFRSGDVRFLVNCNVLTTGFDAPNVDCVALLRPTMSPGLYCQQVGRGFRLHPGKQNCLVLDYAGNILRHGPVDAIQIREPNETGNGEAPAKECPQCHSVIALGYQICPDCGYEFPAPEKKRHEAKASTAGILTGQATVTEYPVRYVRYTVHEKRDAPPDAPRTMRAEYQIGYTSYQSEWICFEHSGYARRKAEAWWTERSEAPVPETAAEAVMLANAGALSETESITIRSVTGEKYDRIVSCALTERPAWREPGWEDEEDDSVAMPAWVGDESIPF